MDEYLDVQHKYRIRSLNIHKITKCLTTSPNVWLYHYLDIFSDVSLDLHWQKSSSTVGCNAIRFAKTWSQKYDKFSTSFTDQVRLLWSSHCEKIHKTHMQSCAIDSRQRLFRCSRREKNCQWNLQKNSKFCQWNLQKLVARIFGQWKLGAPSQMSKCLTKYLTWSLNVTLYH